MAEISLNASMRSNLLSLQQTQKLQDSTQSRLSTGLKVNSAIDNPSSFYTASSLNNRAEDLGALLDAMTQGIQTIKAANEALETGTAILQQAKASASQFAVDYNPTKVDVQQLVSEQKQQRLSANPVPENVTRDWLLANGADYVIESEADLRNAALNATTGQTIVIKDSVNITTDTNISFSQGVKLLGVENFNPHAIAADGGYQSKITVNSKAILVFNGNNEVSGLELSSTAQYGIQVLGVGNNIENMTINMNYPAASSSGIYNLGELAVNNLNIITNNQQHSIGINNSKTISVDGYLNIETGGKWGHAVSTYANSVTTIEATANVNIHTFGEIAIGFDQDRTAFLDIKGGILNVVSEQSYAFLNEAYSTITGGNTIAIASGTELNINATVAFSSARGGNGVVNPQTGIAENIIRIADNVKMKIYDNANKAQSEFISNSAWSNSARTTINRFGLNFASIDSFTPIISTDKVAEKTSFNSILNQYNQLLSDASYKGVNLLQQGNLKINFNEERSSKIEINGVDASSEALGIIDREWVNHLDAQTSIAELDAAINQLRTYTEQFGNYYSIVSTRQEFTENLINVLTEGADKLTLADMNEESANMLALQTRQQLAINSLSLASQAAQSVLKLF